jgi:HD-GYP domain-containing protein (c-di-GMP phosphodiesterase class II)
MTADLPYRASMGVDGAREELQVCAGTQFHPNAVEAFLRALDRKAGARRLPAAVV